MHIRHDAAHSLVPTFYDQNAHNQTTFLQLHVVVKQPHLLAGLERRHADVRTPVAAESIAQATVPA